MTFNIYDEDGFIALLNADQYKAFVDEDWSLPQLLTHFISQMNAQNLVIWQTNNNGGGAWDVEVLGEHSSKHAFRTFSQTIQVTNGALYLTTYTDLTMAAQFEDEPLPSKQNADLKLPMENGMYLVTVRQLFHPNTSEEEDIEGAAFELILERTEMPGAKIESIYWWEQQ